LIHWFIDSLVHLFCGHQSELKNHQNFDEARQRELKMDREAIIGRKIHHEDLALQIKLEAMNPSISWRRPKCESS